MPFITLTPNLALDRTLTLNSPLTPENLHRVGKTSEVAGGKGVNVARTLRVLGAEVTVTGFLGGFNGHKFRHLLTQEGLTGVFGEVEGETRECHILLDGRSHPTEVYEGGPLVTAGDWRLLIERLPAAQLIISGSLPAGLAPDTFGKLLQELPHKPVVDSSGHALRVALEAGVALVKPNLAELQSLLSVSNNSVSSNGITEAGTLYDVYGVPILLSLGAAGAAYVAEETLIVSAPKIQVLNPVASGDCLLAAFVWARAEGWSLLDALRLGVAAGAENAAAGGGARVTQAGILRRWEAARKT